MSWQEGMDAAGLDAVSWLSCRHTFASRLVMAGVDLRTVQELGGWRTLALVTRYAHMHPDHLRPAVERPVQPGGQWETVPGRRGMSRYPGRSPDGSRVP